MAYLTQLDLENALSASTVLALYDTGYGAVDTVAVAAVCQRASDTVDSYMATEYPGPWPTTAPIPAMMKENALQYAIAFSFMRHPEYVRQYGDDARSKDLFAEAKAMSGRIADAIQIMVERPGQEGNVGGVALTGGPRLMIDAANGTPVASDF